MALQVENFLIPELNLNLPTAYCRFSGLFWHGGTNIDIRTDIYANEEAREKNLQPITSKQYSVLLNDPMAEGDLERSAESGDKKMGQSSTTQISHDATRDDSNRADLISQASPPLAVGKIQPLVYTLLKTLPEFKGAVDA